MRRRQPLPRRPLPRQRLPRLWMMTDERQGDSLLPALARLPRGTGVVFRHYTLAPDARRALFARVRAIARRRGLVLLLAGDPATARRWGADGWHGKDPARPRPSLLRTAPAHHARDLRTPADALFLSPLHPTRSHPGAPALGPVRFALLARLTKTPVIALGGMNARRGRAALRIGAHGWAAIDGLTAGWAGRPS